MAHAPSPRFSGEKEGVLEAYRMMDQATVIFPFGVSSIGPVVGELPPRGPDAPGEVRRAMPSRQQAGRDVPIDDEAKGGPEPRPI